MKTITYNFYVGQKVVCICGNDKRPVNPKLKTNGLYTVAEVRKPIICVKEIEFIIFKKDRFIPLTEYRKLKIKEIYE